MQLAFRILNVFVLDGDPFSGNPLCVFEDGRGLSDAQMQALARQLNLSETTFLLPPTTAEATRQVRIFTPTFELPFAGHPTLGSAAVVHSLLAADEQGGAARLAGAAGPAGRAAPAAPAAPARLTLEMRAGLVPVVQGDDRRTWRLRTARAPAHRPVGPAPALLAAMLGLPESALAPPPHRPLWVNTGADQLIIPLVDAAAVAAARPDPALLAAHGYSEIRGGSMAYVWAPDSTPGSAADRAIVARFFFLANGSVVEDPATGSACANLGGWFLAHQAPLPLTRTISQGAAVGRPSRLELSLDASGAIFVAGAVLELGRGSFEL
jgi:PhzF family phenazine biosynthesis protein